MTRLDISICTYGAEGIARLAGRTLPRIDGVRYVVSWQNHGDIPVPVALDAREDVDVYRCSSVGLSNNRNNALECSRSDFVMISDDDVEYSAEGIESMMGYVDSHPSTAVFTFILERSGTPVYPACETVLEGRYPKGYRVCSCEMVVRKSLLGDLRFHPDFGINSPDMHAGEDELFHLTAMRRGLECRFAPILIGRHPHAHTGFGKKMSAKVLRAQGCVATLLYPRSFMPRLLLKTWRLKKHGQSGIFKSLIDLSSGAIRAFKLLHTDRARLWP